MRAHVRDFVHDSMDFRYTGVTAEFCPDIKFGTYWLLNYVSSEEVLTNSLIYNKYCGIKLLQVGST